MAYLIAQGSLESRTVIVHGQHYRQTLGTVFGAQKIGRSGLIALSRLKDKWILGDVPLLCLTFSEGFRGSTSTNDGLNESSNISHDDSGIKNIDCGGVHQIVIGL